MGVTFDDAVPEEARDRLTWFILRMHEVGVPCKCLRTVNLGERDVVSDQRDRIVYKFTDNEGGDFHVTVEDDD
jgi:hypothetical protein